MTSTEALQELKYRYDCGERDMRVPSETFFAYRSQVQTVPVIKHADDYVPRLSDFPPALCYKDALVRLDEKTILGADIILTDVELASCATLQDAELMVDRKIVNLRSAFLRHLHGLWSERR